jgi:uncharacterized iron-regulated membrane protein
MLKPRKIFLWMHLAAGCTVGIVILIMSVTGILLSYQRQITAWADRGYRRPPAAARMPIDVLVGQAAPFGKSQPTALLLRADPRAPAEISFGRDRTLLLNPYTGAVLGEESPALKAFFRRTEDWHRWLGAQGDGRKTARLITGCCNLAFLFLVVSGPILRWPRKWRWKNVRHSVLIRGSLSGRARDWNWHNVVGAWSAIPLFVIVLTAVVMSFPWANNLLYRLTGNQPPQQNAAAQAEQPEKHRRKPPGGRRSRGRDVGFSL